MSFRILGALGALVLTAVLALAPGEAASAAPRSERIAGADRYATSVAVSRAAYPDGRGVDAVVVASGATAADGVSAGPVAARLGGPLLLTARGSLPTSVAAEIRRLQPGRIVIAGGTVAVSAAVERALRDLAPAVERIAGEDRYATSRALVRRAFGTDASEREGAAAGGAPHVYLATGAAFPDALVGGGLAASAGAPLVVVAGAQSRPAVPLLRALAELGTTRVTVVGGPGAVSNGIVAGLRGAGMRVDRLQGADRFATSHAAAARFPASAREVIVVSGLSFPDAMSAVTLSARRGAPIVLSRPLCADAGLRALVSSRSVTRLTTVGGPVAVRGLVGALTRCWSTTGADSPWVLVNKKNALRPKDYVPSGLRQVAGGSFLLRSGAATAMEEMFAAARRAGAGTMRVHSAYRSYATQQRLYAGYVRTRGAAWADVHSARAGHSEHQTGLTADIVACRDGRCGGIYDFEGTAQQRWVAANAWRYGFIVRYENGRTTTTGYTSEPWHLRWVGKPLAADYVAGGFHTLEDYLGYPAARHY